jgi:putative ABC transport system permease protein
VERILLIGTSPNYFELLGARPALGRTYTQSEWVPGFLDGVVISDGLWKRQFGSDPHIIGRRVRVDEDAYTVIGVMPPDFRHPANTDFGEIEMWTAAGFTGASRPSPPQRGARLCLVRRSPEPGVTIAQAQRQLMRYEFVQPTYAMSIPNKGWFCLRPPQTSPDKCVRRS